MHDDYVVFLVACCNKHACIICVTLVCIITPHFSLRFVTCRKVPGITSTYIQHCRRPVFLWWVVIRKHMKQRIGYRMRFKKGFSIDFSLLHPLINIILSLVQMNCDKPMDFRFKLKVLIHKHKCHYEYGKHLGEGMLQLPALAHQPSELHH